MHQLDWKLQQQQKKDLKMALCNPLYPADEIQLLINTYLPQDDEQYYLDLDKFSSLHTSHLPESLPQYQQQRHDGEFSSLEDSLPLDVFEFISDNSCQQRDMYYNAAEHCSFPSTDVSRCPGSESRCRNLRDSPCYPRSSDSDNSFDGAPDDGQSIPLPVTKFKDEVVEIKTESPASPHMYGPRTPDSVSGESMPPTPSPQTVPGGKQRRKRPSRRRQKQLWEFILETLSNPKHNPECIMWLDRDAGIFKFVKSQQVARLWGMRRQREMSYEYFSRAMRHYYARNIMKRVPGKRLVYQFCSGAEGWQNYAMNSPV